MNFGILATAIMTVFLAIKYAMSYRSPDVRVTIQDAVVCFVASFGGAYLYTTYYDVKPAQKVTAVFTDVLKP